MPEYNPSTANIGLNLDNSASQVAPGQVTYALNAVVESFNGEEINYQTESANELCTNFPEGLKVIGSHNIVEKGFTLFFLAGIRSEIGKVEHDSCNYIPIISGECLNFSIDHPIHKASHRIGNCSTEVYWTDNFNPRRFIDLEELPWKETQNCPTPVTTDELDCNKILINPKFSIPSLSVIDVDSDGDLEAGTYQFAFQYSNANGDGYTSYYSVTNPTPVFDITKITLDFNYKVNKSIKVSIDNIDTSGYFDYFNLAVIKTVNNISSVQLVGTYSIDGTEKEINYTGQGVADRLSINDIFEKFPLYEVAEDITDVNDTLIWANLSSVDRINYQSIANKITLKWQTTKIKDTQAYQDPVIATNFRGYMRDEVYPVEIVFLLTKGKQTDGFHIPARIANSYDTEIVTGNDVLSDDNDPCTDDAVGLPRWKVYNTATVEFTNPSVSDCPTPGDVHQYGDFSYWESEETYPCTEQWGELANRPIRHPKFPDSLITHIHDNQGFIYPIGIRIDTQEILDLIQSSNLTTQQKADIQGFKIVRGNRVNNKSVVAKGLIHNIGKYQREGQSYYFPNYPYNDLRQDPYISSSSNDLTSETGETTIDYCLKYKLRNSSGSGVFPFLYKYTDCDGVERIAPVQKGSEVIVCSKTEPELQTAFGGGFSEAFSTGFCGDISIVTGPETITTNPFMLNGFGTEDSFSRYTFHSPDTSFYQPNLGSFLKLETAEFGLSKGHFQEVKEHSKYKFVSNEAFVTGLAVGIAVGFASSTFGLSTNVFNGTAAFTAYLTFLDIVEKVIPHKNFTYQYNSIGRYTDFRPVSNEGNKQRRLDLASYLAPGMQSVGDSLTINNYQRESSVYIKTQGILPRPESIPDVPADESRWVLSQNECRNEILEKDISSFYASIKRGIPDQYGQIYSYETIDTGYQFIGTSTNNRFQVVFGGDIFINKFGYKSKLPFFIDNRVSTGSKTYPNGSDIFYNELGNVGNPNYWFSTDATKGRFRVLGINLAPLFGIKAFQFDCRDSKFFYDFGKIYLFAYGIPYFYCESEVNVDYRQAFNTKEGDFYPRVSSDIPDDWFQEVNTTIQQDNTYHYNKTYSKQNKENLFTHLPPDFEGDQCEVIHPFRVIFSDQGDWLTYRSLSKFDLPQNYGRLVSLEGIENRAVLARFENKSLLYNALLTAPTNAQDVYLGQSLFDQRVPPLDYAETLVGYAGSQHKMFIKTEFGHISTDAKRGKVLMYQGTKVEDITNKLVSKFFEENMKFYISKRFPTYPIDNHFKGVGLHGVFDTKYSRFILTKLDYEPKSNNIIYIEGKFFVGNKEIQLTDTNYFINRSFTISYDFQNGAWISFHSYLPNYYIGENGFFYSGNDSLWRHNTNYTEFIKFYDQQAPYTLEHPYAFKFQDEILQSVKDYSKVYTYLDDQTYVEVDDSYFNKLIIYNNQQCSGNILLTKKPSNKLSSYGKYPVYNTDSKEVLYTKSDNFYQVNTFWDMVKSITSPIFTKSSTNLSFLKDLNQSNMDYSKRSFRKGPLRGKDLKLRFTLDNRTDIKIISQIMVSETTKSWK